MATSQSQGQPTSKMITATTARAPVYRQNSDCKEEEATHLIRQGLADAFKREKAKKRELSQVPIQQRKDTITENFPNVQGEELITAMSETDLMKLKLEAYYSEKRRMKEMFKKVQEQISEYHELLEYSNQMEIRLEKLRKRVRSLEEECKEKTLKVSELESEVINLKVNLANEKSSSDKISNELARVKSENQDLVKTLSMQSFSNHNGMRQVSTNLSLRTTYSNSSSAKFSNSDRFSLVRPKPRPPSPHANHDVAEFINAPMIAHSRNGSIGEFMNGAVSWVSSHTWGSRASLASEQDQAMSALAEHHHPFKNDTACCATKSDATVATASVNFNSGGSIFSSVTANNSGGQLKKNDDWSEIRPMVANLNPLLMQVSVDESSNNLEL